MTARLVIACALLAWAGAAQAQLPGLPGVGLPGSGLPGAGLQSGGLATTPAIPQASVRPAIPQRVAPPPMPAQALGVLPAINANPLPVVRRDLDVTQGLAADANAALGLSAAVDDAFETLETAAPYRERARGMLRRHPRVLEPDAEGRPVVRGEVMAVGVSAVALDRARRAGFRVGEQRVIAGLDLATAVVRPPRGVSGPDALQRLRAMDPAGRYDLNHIYLESGGAMARQAGIAAARPSGVDLRLGLIDGTAQRSHPTLRAVRVVQRAFAPGGARVTAHATAVASLLAGSGSGFQGAAPGAGLFVADVYGTTPAGGSALSVARALGWLVQSHTPVIDISLVGPPNALLEAAVAAATARGHLIVAAVGNDGPAAAPLYPAAYPGVVAVSAVDARRRVLPEAGRGGQVAFAAPGGDMLAAGLDGGLVAVRGTSFAAPLVAGRLARLLPTPQPAAAERAVAALAREAIDAGAPGRDPVYGRGLVALGAAVRPAAATARR